MNMLESATNVCSILKNNGFEAYVVGGACRDLFLNKSPKDYDIVTNAHPDKVGSLFKKSMEIGESFGIVNVIHYGHNFEIATFREDSKKSNGRKPDEVKFVGSLKEDFCRRDFTMNAIYYDPLENSFFDPAEGKIDIHNKTIRFIGNPFERLEEDRLRALRAIRFSAQLNFEIEKNSLEALNSLGHSEDPFRHLCSSEEKPAVAWERIREEFKKIITSKNPVKGIIMLKELGFLHHIIPEFDNMWCAHQSKRWHQEGSCAIHTLLVLSNCSTDSFVDRMACLLHDIGKPETLKLKDLDDGWWKLTNPQHDVIGKPISERICLRFKMTSNEIDEITTAVRYHMDAHQLVDWKKTHKIRRFLGQKYFNSILKLALADEKGSISKEPYESIQLFVDKWNENYPEMLPTPFITGNDLISMGHKPSPEFKIMLDLAYDRQLDGWSKEEIIKRLPKVK